jgi:hypothetical protein
MKWVLRFLLIFYLLLSKPIVCAQSQSQEMRPQAQTKNAPVVSLAWESNFLAPDQDFLRWIKNKNFSNKLELLEALKNEKSPFSDLVAKDNFLIFGDSQSPQGNAAGITDAQGMRVRASKEDPKIERFRIIMWQENPPLTVTINANNTQNQEQHLDIRRFSVWNKDEGAKFGNQELFDIALKPPHQDRGSCINCHDQGERKKFTMEFDNVAAGESVRIFKGRCLDCHNHENGIIDFPDIAKRGAFHGTVNLEQNSVEASLLNDYDKFIKQNEILAFFGKPDPQAARRYSNFNSHIKMDQYFNQWLQSDSILSDWNFLLASLLGCDDLQQKTIPQFDLTSYQNLKERILRNVKNNSLGPNPQGKILSKELLDFHGKIPDVDLKQTQFNANINLLTTLAFYEMLKGNSPDKVFSETMLRGSFVITDTSLTPLDVANVFWKKFSAKVEMPASLEISVKEILAHEQQDQCTALMAIESSKLSFKKNVGEVKLSEKKKVDDRERENNPAKNDLGHDHSGIGSPNLNRK